MPGVKTREELIAGAQMKYSNLRSFQKHLQEAAPQHFVPVYMLLGKDDFDRKEAVQQLVPALLGKSKPPDHALRVFDGERLSIDEVEQDLHSMTLFADRRVVLINHAEKLNKQATSKLEKYFENPNPSLFLVISASTINRATRFYKNAEKMGIVLDIAEEKPWEKENSLAQKVVEKVQKQGKTIDQNTSRYLIKYAGMDQASLQQEVEKLICYVGERSQITEEDICAICTGVNTKNVWQLGDAIFRRDAKLALSVANGLLADGESFFGLVRLIRSQFQTKFRICSIFLAGGGDAEVQKQFPYMRGQILQQNTQLARSYGTDRFRKGLLAIDHSELLAKNSGLSYPLLFERLIFTLTTA
ncbi:MAG: hypothetical protein K940chlam7_01151 [Chlamydiae bacterium]|nr:hypothetical protein [Chlamydiota bacterium]